MSTDQRFATTIAKQEIIELRMQYARATDLIGMTTKLSIEQGRAIYHQIFTPDAQVGADGIDPVIGPDAWVDIVESALGPYQATQHLIGTALVSAIVMPDANGKGGSAIMSSYLQAWHSTAENSLYMFMGTYHDTCVFSAEHGWQIKTMLLKKLADEIRDVVPRAGGLASS